jgi:long-subunit fatty acid transport protein
MYKYIVGIFFLCYFITNSSWSQIVSSPYAIIGIGREMPKGTVRNNAMGGTGVSMGSYSSINMLNPALLTYNSFTVFELSGIGERKIISTNNQSQSGFGGALAYFGFVFPVNNRWKLGVGLRPFSKVNYSASSITKIEGAPNFVEQTLTGSGGLSQFYLSQGFFIAKGLSLGLNISYNFDRYVVGKFERTNYKDFVFQPGVHYSLELKKEQYLHFGAVYEFKNKHNIQFFDALEIRDLTNDLTTYSDTLFYDAKSKITYPSSFTIGVSYEKLGKFAFGIDYSKENWSEYVSRSSPALKDIQKISVGGEFTPDFRSISNYFKRITYRIGFKYEELPINFAGKQLDDFSISGGISLPMSKGFSSINLSGSYGIIDGEKEGLITERYIRFNIGLAINDRWFVKRKIN